MVDKEAEDLLRSLADDLFEVSTNKKAASDAAFLLWQIVSISEGLGHHQPHNVRADIAMRHDCSFDIGHDHFGRVHRHAEAQGR